MPRLLLASLLIACFCGLPASASEAPWIDIAGYCFATPAGPSRLPNDLRRGRAHAGEGGDHGRIEAGGDYSGGKEVSADADRFADHGTREGVGSYIVQARGPVTAEWRAAIERAGAVLYGYVPQFAFLARMDAAAREGVASVPGTFWIGRYHPAYRIAPRLAQKAGLREALPDGRERAVTEPRDRAPASGAGSPGRRVDLRMRVFRDLTPVELASLQAAAAAAGAEVGVMTDDGFSRRFQLRAPLDAIDELACIPGVRWIEEVPRYELYNSTTCWVLQSNRAGATPLWDRGLHGEEQIVTMMDSGIDYNSCWFRDPVAGPPGPDHRKVIDYTALGEGLAYDGCEDGHGTHVAGTLCGDQSFLEPGNIEYNGLAYAARMTVQDIGTDDEDACTYGSVAPPASLVEAFSAAHALGARVHTNSWGSVTHAYTSYSVDVDYAMWTHPDLLICFAAGNYGPLQHSVGAPGTAKNCVTVGACLRAPGQENIAGYSSRGPATTTDARYKPTLLAPGGGVSNPIVSANNDPGNPPAVTCNTAAAGFYGTSMATPAVAGLGALVRQYFAAGFYPGGMHGGDGALVPSAALVKAVLVAGSRDTGIPNIPNNSEGWGRVLLDDALYFAGDTRELLVVDAAPGLLTGESDALELAIDSSAETLAVALVWTDYPGTEGGGVKLVNDLDLRVTAPDATEYFGNVFSGGASAAGGSYDRLNVEECVRLPAPACGTYLVTVTGYNVPQGPQPYALAVNGAIADFPPVPPAGREAGDPESRLRAAPQLSVRPTPARGWLRLHYTVPAGYAGPVLLDLLDLEGRLVRRLVAKGQRAGRYAASWDGRDGVGRRLAEGVYFARLSVGAQRVTAKVLLSR